MKVRPTKQSIKAFVDGAVAVSALAAVVYGVATVGLWIIDLPVVVVDPWTHECIKAENSDGPIPCNQIPEWYIAVPFTPRGH